jgi:hypothetical protein
MSLGGAFGNDAHDLAAGCTDHYLGLRAAVGSGSTAGARVMSS